MVAHDGGTRSRLALASHCSNSTSTPPPFPQNSCTKANPLYLSRANPTTRESGAPVLLHKVSPRRIRVSEKTPSRNCLENPDGLHFGVSEVGKTRRETPLLPLCGTKDTQSRASSYLPNSFRETV